jgi:Fis family transcriptional regulator
MESTGTRPEAAALRAERDIHDGNGEGKIPLDGSLEDLTRRMTSTYFHQLGSHRTSGLYDLFISQVERGLLGVVLEQTGGNQTRAAQILGINRGTLRKKLRSCQLR